MSLKLLLRQDAQQKAPEEAGGGRDDLGMRETATGEATDRAERRTCSPDGGFRRTSVQTTRPSGRKCLDERRKFLSDFIPPA